MLDQRTRTYASLVRYVTWINSFNSPGDYEIKVTDFEGPYGDVHKIAEYDTTDHHVVVLHVDYGDDGGPQTLTCYYLDELFMAMTQEFDTYLSVVFNDTTP